MSDTTETAPVTNGAPLLEQHTHDESVAPTLEQVFTLARRLSPAHQRALIARLEAMLQTPPINHDQSERAWQNFQAIREILAQMPQYMTPEEALREVRGDALVHD